MTQLTIIGLLASVLSMYSNTWLYQLIEAVYIEEHIVFAHYNYTETKDYKRIIGRQWSIHIFSDNDSYNTRY